ncbi:hypothetical protein BX600DRAFT_456108 [Xylariales sp. PMI_506]|nr:hypothetical protein BX600DRAFT_456108 [Xylariales sp. PMI_506]
MYLGCLNRPMFSDRMNDSIASKHVVSLTIICHAILCTKMYPPHRSMVRTMKLKPKTADLEI